MTSAAYLPPAIQRVPSGIPGLDTVLCGGFLKGGIYLIMGPPGVGKTIMGNQFSFSHVAAGGQVVYLTLLAETHARMFAHMQSMEFFNPAPIANTLYYISGYSALEQDGLKGLMTLLRNVTRNHHATLLVIDGLMTAEEVGPSDLHLKQFLHELHVYTETIGCTTLLLSQFDSTDMSRPEFVMVDGLIELSERLVDMRALREVVVRKFRGSNMLGGRHLFEISNKGMTIHPRTEALFSYQTAQSVTIENTERQLTIERKSFGIPHLDEMIEGGLPANSSTIILGSPGTGKTLLGLHFLMEGAQRGENGLLFGFNEMPAQLISKAYRFRLDFLDAINNGLINVLWQSPVQDILDVFAERLLEAVKQRNVKRVFIDGLNGFSQTPSSEERLGLFISSLIRSLTLLGVTIVCTVELPELFSPIVKIPVEGTTSLTDNIIFLRYVELRSQLYRLLSIMKIRDSSYDPSIREFRITEQGIELASTFQSAEAILTGVAHPASFQDTNSEPTSQQQGQE